MLCSPLFILFQAEDLEYAIRHDCLSESFFTAVGFSQGPYVFTIEFFLKSVYDTANSTDKVSIIRNQPAQTILMQKMLTLLYNLHIQGISLYP